MLRIVTQRTDAEAELKRISDRIQTGDQVHREATVREIVQTVQRKKDKALIDYTAEFDGVELTVDTLRVTGAELEAAYQAVSPQLVDAIRMAQQRIETFHRQRVPKGWVTFSEPDIVLGKRYTAVDRAGLYVPGGRAAYPSTVLMNAVPAKVAGVKETVMVTPPGSAAIGDANRQRSSGISPAVLVAAQEAGIDKIYRVGGAQAIAALAYGTETIPKVDVISGPGNIYVTLAKKHVYGTVGIDSLAGPSEVLVIADSTANPAFLAADLLAQAEHDPLAAAILLTTDYGQAQQVVVEVKKQLEKHPRRTLTEKAIAHYGVIIVVENLDVAVALSNLFAPEHLELEVAEPWDVIEGIRHAGAIFMGHNTPEAVGDYIAGPNHTLPTCGAARYASALGVETFMKHSSVIEYSSDALQEVSEAIAVLTDAEGLPSHGASVRLRLEDLGMDA
ncbi:MAG: histidinol dehydrogenase [Cyanobacteria bacterium P01_E01_bin.34]